MSDSRYSVRQRHDYTPPPCPVCGGTTDVTWVDALRVEENPNDPDQPQYMPGTYECRHFTHGED